MRYRPHGVSSRLGDLPRVPLAQLPTPLMAAENLARELGGPTILIKRDDLTGMAAGGNKARKLEFLLAEAKRRGCDHVITCGAAQSNHACQTAASAATLGMKCTLVLWSPNSPATGRGSGNVLLDELMGAQITFIGKDEGISREVGMEREADRIRAEGGKPYIIPMGGSVGLGSVGYALSLEEAADQCHRWDRLPTKVVIACGSGGSAAGVMVGAVALDLEAEVLSIDVDGDDTLLPAALRCARECAGHLGMDPTPWVDGGGVSLVEGYVGPGYGIPSEAGVEAIKLVARAEGILLDPVYSAKAMSALIGLVRDGSIAADDTVLFFHTGGLPGLFALGPQLLDK